MKFQSSLVYLLFSSFIFVGCIQKSQQKEDSQKEGTNNKVVQKEEVKEDQELIYLGQRFTTEKAMSVSELERNLYEGRELNAKITGKVMALSASKNQWIMEDEDSRQPVFVVFEDDFFVPKDQVKGTSVIIQGHVAYRTLSVVVLKDIAKGLGVSENDLADITGPKRGIVMIPRGVILEDYEGNISELKKLMSLSSPMENSKSKTEIEAPGEEDNYKKSKPLNGEDSQQARESPNMIFSMESPEDLYFQQLSEKYPGGQMKDADYEVSDYIDNTGEYIIPGTDLEEIRARNESALERWKRDLLRADSLDQR